MLIENYYGGVSAASGLLFSIMIGTLTYNALSPRSQTGEKTGAVFAGMIRKARSKSMPYIRMESWLKKSGASYHIGKAAEPVRLVSVCMVMGMAGFLAGMSISAGCGIAMGIMLSLLLPVTIPVLNRSDNRKMLPDIRLIYHSIGVQIKSGVYVTDALAECSSSVKSKRLRDALSGFYAEMIMKSDIYVSLERFRASFDNRYIDSLCMTVVQAMESGQALELLSDITEQIRDMEKEVFESRKAGLDRMLTLSQLLVLGAVLGTALYTCIIYMLGKAVGFRGL